MKRSAGFIFTSTTPIQFSWRIPPNARQFWLPAARLGLMAWIYSSEGMIVMDTNIWDKETFAARLREVGTGHYHHKHPFHRLMNEGKVSPGAIRGGVANRYYYQGHL